MAYFSFNASARNLLNEEPKIRVRMVEGVLQIKPTDRESGAMLPNGETLRPVTYRVEKDTITGARFTAIGLVGNFISVGDTFLLQKEKYGWFSLRVTLLEPSNRNHPIVKIVK